LTLDHQEGMSTSVIHKWL